jgi:hypothetical protein
MLDFELLWKVITLLTYMTHIGTFVLNLVTGNAVVLKKLELWKVYRLTVARHFQSETLNWDSGRGELNIDCTYKGSVTRFSIWFSFSKQNHIVWTQKSNIEVRIKMSFQYRLLKSYFHPTVWWESYRENGKRKGKRTKNEWKVRLCEYLSIRLT